MQQEHSDTTKKTVIAIHLGRENDDWGNDKSAKDLANIKQAGERKGRIVETKQFFLPISSQSQILNDNQLDDIAEISKKNDLTGGENTQVILLFNHSPSHGVILKTQYTIHDLANIFNDLATKGVKPNINFVACAFGGKPWSNNRRETGTLFGEFLNSIKHPRPGQKISGYRSSVFFDKAGRKIFDFGTGDREHKESLTPHEKQCYKNMFIYDDNGEWLEASRTEYTSKVGSGKDSIAAEEASDDVVSSRNRIARNVVGNRNFQHSGKDFFEKHRFVGDIKGKIIGRDSKGNVGLLQLAPATENNSLRFIWFDPNTYGLESIKNGDYVYFNAKMSAKDGEPTRQINAEQVDLSLKEGLILELSNMSDKQIAEYRKIKNVPDTELLPGTYSILKKTDSALYAYDGDQQIIKMKHKRVSERILPGMTVNIGAQPNIKPAFDCSFKLR